MVFDEYSTEFTRFRHAPESYPKWGPHHASRKRENIIATGDTEQHDHRWSRTGPFDGASETSIESIPAI